MSASVPPVPTPTDRECAKNILAEFVHTQPPADFMEDRVANHITAHVAALRAELDECYLKMADATEADIRRETELTQLTASSRALVEDAATWKEMALRLDAKVIDEQRDHVKTCGYHDETKAALKASQATNRVLIQHLREMRACVRHAVPGFITREFAEEIDAVDELLRLAPTLHAQAGEEPAK